MITYASAGILFLLFIGFVCISNYLYNTKKKPVTSYITLVLGCLFLFGLTQYVFNEIGIENKPMPSQIKKIEYSDTLEKNSTVLEEPQTNSIFERGEQASEKNTEENNKAKERFKNIK